MTTRPYRPSNGTEGDCFIAHFCDRCVQGAGIVVCDRWRRSFSDFLADMGAKPTTRHSIDRLDSARNYEPGNCVWATPREQARHTTRNRRLVHDGRDLTLAEWAEITGLKRETISDRIASGWSVDRALTTPRIANRQRNNRGHFV